MHFAGIEAIPDQHTILIFELQFFSLQSMWHVPFLCMMDSMVCEFNEPS